MSADNPFLTAIKNLTSNLHTIDTTISSNITIPNVINISDKRIINTLNKHINESASASTSKIITKYNYSYYVNNIEDKPLHILLLYILCKIDISNSNVNNKKRKYYIIINNFFKHIIAINNILKKTSAFDFSNKIIVTDISVSIKKKKNLFIHLKDTLKRSINNNFTINNDFTILDNKIIIKKILGSYINFYDNPSYKGNENTIEILNIILYIHKMYNAAYHLQLNYTISCKTIINIIIHILFKKKHFDLFNKYILLYNSYNNISIDIKLLTDYVTLEQYIPNPIDLSTNTSYYINFELNDIIITLFNKLHDFLLTNKNSISSSIRDEIANIVNNHTYLIINKDKDIIDVFKENPEVEQTYNIDNNGFELKELDYDIIFFNEKIYKLNGLITYNNEYNVLQSPNIKANFMNSKLLIYKIDETKSPYTDNKDETIENILDSAKQFLTDNDKILLNVNCTNINLYWVTNSCYIDTLFVALFSAKHKYMDELLYNLEYNPYNKYIKRSFNNNNVIIIKDNDINYNILLLKQELIDKYKNISMKTLTTTYTLNKFRNYLVDINKISNSAKIYKLINENYVINDANINNIDTSKATLMNSTSQLYNDIIDDYNLNTKKHYTENNIDPNEIISLFENIFKKFIYHDISLNNEIIYIKFNYLQSNLSSINSIKKRKSYFNNSGGYSNIKFTINDTNTYYSNIIDINNDTNINTKNYFKIIEKINVKNTLDIKIDHFINKSDKYFINKSDKYFIYDMTDKNYKLYNNNYNDPIKGNIENLSKTDFLDIKNYYMHNLFTDTTKNDYIRHSTLNTYRDNIHKNFIIKFDIINNTTNDKYIIIPADKLYLNNEIYENNVKNQNTKYLSLQSIIFFSKGVPEGFKGTDTRSGHYTCLFKCEDKWYYYNDSPFMIKEYSSTLDKIHENSLFKNLLIRLLYYI